METSSTGRRGNPNWTKGTSGNPLGRTPGSLDRWQRAQAEAAASGEFNPLDWGIALVRKDPVALAAMRTDADTVSDWMRLKALNIIAPYCFRRMPQAVEFDANFHVHVEREVLEQLTDAELAQAATLTERVAALRAQRSLSQEIPDPMVLLEPDHA